MENKINVPNHQNCMMFIYCRASVEFISVNSNWKMWNIPWKIPT